jgi:regulator of nucleoside diphosphate kinase
VFNQFLPNVTIPSSDHRRLEEIACAAAEKGDADAMFLMGEIIRAEVVPDRSARLDSIVTMKSWVTFKTNWSFPQETRQLVYPEDYMSDKTQISVLSPLGAALIGLRVGTKIPFFAAGSMNALRVESVGRSNPMLSRSCFMFPWSGSSAITIREQRPRKCKERMQ